MVFQFNCAPCSGSDPVQDTVKVDLSICSNEDKENNSLGRNVGQTKTIPASKFAAAEVAVPTASQLLADKNTRLEAEHKAFQAAEDARRKQQEQRLEVGRNAFQAAEDARHEEEETQRLQVERRQALAAEDARRKQENEDARAAAEVAERLRQEKEAAAAAERLRQDQEQQERETAEKHAAIEKAQAYLSANRFTNVNDLRKSTLKAKRPLHSAVKTNDVETVRCLLVAGADPSLTNSAGKTARQVAEALNRNGSHSGVLTALTTPVPAFL